MVITTEHRSEDLHLTVKWNYDSGFNIIEMAEGLEYVLQRTILSEFQFRRLQQAATTWLEHVTSTDEDLRETCIEIINLEWKKPFIMTDRQNRFYNSTNPF